MRVEVGASGDLREVHHEVRSQQELSVGGEPAAFFVYGSLRPDDDSRMPWTQAFVQGMDSIPAKLRGARMYEDTYASVVLGHNTVVGRTAEQEKPYADSLVQSEDEIVGILLVPKDKSPEAFARKLRDADRIEGYPSLYRRAMVDAIPKEGGDPIRAYIYHRPDCDRSNHISTGDWLKRRTK